MKFTNKLLGKTTGEIEEWGFDEEKLREYDGDYHDLAVTKMQWWETCVHYIVLTRKNGQKSPIFKNKQNTQNRNLEF